MDPNSPSRGQKHICLLFESEAHYQACVADPAKYRAHLIESQQRHPELFPQAFAAGFAFHDTYQSRKQKGLVLRRIRLKQTRDVFTLRPSFVMPHLIGRSEEVEKALYLRQWDLPFEALAYVFGRDAMYWYRAWLPSDVRTWSGRRSRPLSACQPIWSPMKRSPGSTKRKSVCQPP